MNTYLVTMFYDNYSFVTRYVVQAVDEDSAIAICEKYDYTPGRTFVSDAEQIDLNQPFWLDTRAR